MHFVIRTRNTPFPEPQWGSRGRELSAFMPLNIEWQQLNYGQGEGQVETGGCEWGFYWTDDNALKVKLHRGQINAADGLAFATSVGVRVFGRCHFEITPGT